MLTQKSQENSKEDGNTKHPPSDLKSKKRSRNWCFTWNNYKDDFDSKFSRFFIGKKCTRYLYQEEVGKNGTPHIQGNVEFKNQVYFNGLTKLDPSIHWEITRNPKAAWEYCKKDDTRTGKIYSYGISPPDIIEDPLEGLTLYEWQKDILELIDTKPDRRTIHWYWEEKGCTGKSSLAFHICLKRKDAIAVSGGLKDVAFAVTSQEIKPKIIIWDIPRCDEEYVSYTCIEKMKGGHFFSGKYESKSTLMNPPHIICFANFKPKEEKMSQDRWRIVKIDNEKETELLKVGSAPTASLPPPASPGFDFVSRKRSVEIDDEDVCTLNVLKKLRESY